MDSPSVVPVTPTALPPHLADWTLPPGWGWGLDGVRDDYRHFQEVVDALGRSLSLVSVYDREHGGWLRDEARALAHRNHPSIPTTYHYWANFDASRRGPGYLRRWIAGETVQQRVSRMGPESVPAVLQILREAGSTIAYLHEAGAVHGCVSPHHIWLSPGGRLWLLGWEWVLPESERPAGLAPDPTRVPRAPELGGHDVEAPWRPTVASDQWQLAAMAFVALTGETPPRHEAPPIQLLRADCPSELSNVLERALHEDPERRFPSVRAMLRAVDRAVDVRQLLISPDVVTVENDSPEARLRWATSDDYEILAPLGEGTFGSVWRARDLTLAREVAIKVLHPHVARDAALVARFHREARLAAQLAHPAIVPIFDSDRRGSVAWYTMELAEGGSVANLIARRGPRAFEEIAAPVDAVLDALSAAHASGIIHRDLKPENVLIDRYRRWRIADFGIAHALGEDADGSSGTPAFAAPEQLLGEVQGVATDLFALGGIVYFALTGRPPFGEGTTQQVLARQLDADRMGTLQLEAFPTPVAEWLERALDPSPDARFPDAKAMRRAWRRVARAMRRASDDGRPWWRRLFEGAVGEEADMLAETTEFESPLGRTTDD